MCRSLHSIHDPYALSHNFSRSLAVCLLRGLFLLCCCMNVKRREHTHLFSSPDFAAAADSVLPHNFHSLSLARAALIADCRLALHLTGLYLFSAIAISFRTSTRWKWSDPVCVMAALNENAMCAKMYYEFLWKTSEFCWRKRKTSADCERRAQCVNWRWIHSSLPAGFLSFGFESRNLSCLFSLPLSADYRSTLFVFFSPLSTRLFLFFVPISFTTHSQVPVCAFCLAFVLRCSCAKTLKLIAKWKQAEKQIHRASANPSSVHCWVTASSTARQTTTLSCSFDTAHSNATRSSL